MIIATVALIPNTGSLLFACRWVVVMATDVVIAAEIVYYLSQNLHGI